MNFILVILIVGFIIAIIFSWIYDIHPEGGIVKTEPAHEAKIEEIPKSSSSWKIASIISFVVIVGLIILNIIPRSGKKEILEKSIAVLPFKNESSDQENTYHINGIMESILDNLCKIEDLRVISRNSVEQYRNNPKPTPVVAEEMDVSYIIEGSGQKIGNRLLLTIQLIVGKDDYHIWSKQYDRNIQQIEDLIDIQQEIAQLVASEIEAIITPEEKQRIEKIPTSNLMAYDLLQRGNEVLNKYWGGDRDKENLEKAEEFFKKALKYDSSFAEAHARLAKVYLAMYQRRDYFSETYLDSVLINADIALSHDKTVSEAYRARGAYFAYKGDLKSADREYDLGITYNPNDYRLYRDKVRSFPYKENVKRLENAYKAVSLKPISRDLVLILKDIAYSYLNSGFYDLAKETAEEVSELGDSVTYYRIFGMIERYQDNHLKSIEYFLKMHRFDTTWNVDLALSYTLVGQYEESLKYYKKNLAILEARNRIQRVRSHRIGYAFWMNGYKKKAEDYLRKQLEDDQQAIHLGHPRGASHLPYYELAAVYAFLGEKEKVLEHLRIFNRRQIINKRIVYLIKNDSLINNIRDEPEFQQIVRDVEAKYQAEHERVRQWLEENDML